jgi:hypothetical protein
MKKNKKPRSYPAKVVEQKNYMVRCETPDGRSEWVLARGAEVGDEGRLTFVTSPASAEWVFRKEE